MSESLTASVVGGSGFTGGELLRLLDGHPNFEVAQATSRSYANKTVGSIHPNLRGMDLRFSDPEDLDSVDVLFACTPHGVSMEHIDSFRDAADTVVDLSADFRLDTEAEYDEWYDGHDRPELLAESEYALPELNRENLPGADLIASGGCNATAAILGLKPLFDADVLSGGERIVVDVKVGSSRAARAAARRPRTPSARASSGPTRRRATATRPRSRRSSARRCRSAPTRST